MKKVALILFCIVTSMKRDDGAKNDVSAILSFKGDSCYVAIKNNRDTTIYLLEDNWYGPTGEGDTLVLAPFFTHPGVRYSPNVFIPPKLLPLKSREKRCVRNWMRLTKKYHSAYCIRVYDLPYTLFNPPDTGYVNQFRIFQKLHSSKIECKLVDFSNFSCN